MRRINAEPLLFILRAIESHPTACLLHTPARLLNLRLANGAASFPIDAFSLHGHQLSGPPSVPFIKASDLFPSDKGERTIEWSADKKRYLHFSEGHYFHDLQLVADYETSEQWTGPLPEFQGRQIPRFMDRLWRHQPLRIALLGDSISVGANASAHVNTFPQQAPYGILWTEQLRKRCVVQIANFSKNGETSKWAKAQVQTVANWNPDLVLLAFGMNDVFHDASPETVAQNVNEAIEGIAAHHRSAEFIIVSGMSPNPEWHLYRQELRNSYHQALLALTRIGVAFCGIKPTWDAVVEKKGFWSMTGNGVNHPNDFGHRIYASCLSLMLLPDESRPENISPGDDICLDDEALRPYFV